MSWPAWNSNTMSNVDTPTLAKLKAMMDDVKKKLPIAEEVYVYAGTVEEFKDELCRRGFPTLSTPTPGLPPLYGLDVVAWGEFTLLGTGRSIMRFYELDISLLGAVISKAFNNQGAVIVIDLKKAEKL